MITWFKRLFGFRESPRLRESRRRDTDRVKQADSKRHAVLDEFTKQCSTIYCPPKGAHVDQV